MSDNEANDKQKTISDFRFGIIADLVYSHATGKELARLIAEKAARSYKIPCSKKKERITESCIRKWLSAYRSNGRDTLIPKIRKDSGVSRSIGDVEKERILTLLEKTPEMGATVAVRTLLREGKITQEISKSALSRFIRSSGFERKVKTQSVKDQIQSFSYEYPLECIQVDNMHSFAVPDHTGKLRKAILIAFLDDATRRILYAHFSFTESALEFERGILHILRSHGRPRRLYTDNGATFVSDQTRRILDTLGIPLIHSRPGMPKGRGKIERFFRTVRNQFEITLDPSSIKSIQDYDMRFRTWLESEYHRQPHSGIGGRTPLEAYLAGTAHIHHVDPSVNLDDVFCHEDTRTVANDGTVSVAGIRYEVPSFLVGVKVKLRSSPLADVPEVCVIWDGTNYGSAPRVDEYANARSRRIMSQDDPSQVAFRSSSGDSSASGGK